MTPQKVFFLEQPGIEDCISNYFSMEKMAFLLTPNSSFHEEQIS